MSKTQYFEMIRRHAGHHETMRAGADQPLISTAWDAVGTLAELPRRRLAMSPRPEHRRHPADHRNALDELMEGTEPPPEQRITPSQKNKANGLRDEYFKKQMQPAMVDFPSVRRFLGHPENQPYVRLYEDTASELEAKLDAWAEPEIPFERLLEVLIGRLVDRDVDLRKNRKLTRTVVFYMYCNCDIAKRLP